MGFALALEKDGIPTIPVSTHVFARLARATCKAEGMPTIRNAYVPQPVVGLSAGELRAYIEGVDPIAKKPFMDIVIEGLTGPLTEEDYAGASFTRTTPRFLEPDTEDNLRNQFIEQGWTDYLPIILPTEQRVEAMLKGTSHPGDEFVNRMSPTSFREKWDYDVEKIAINAVMAGCKPEYMPVVLALCSTGFSARSSSTTSWAALSMINGPIRHEIGMNCGIGALGPYNHANATIGRAYNLLSQNAQGGSEPGDTYMGSVGNNWNYTACWAENEEDSPWEPFHVQKGHKAEESTAAIWMGGWYTEAGFGPRETWKEKLIRMLVATDHFSSPFLLMDPLVAKDFARMGFTKESLSEWMSENARMKAKYYWDDQWTTTLVKPVAEAGIEPAASRLKADPEEEISIFAARDLDIVVVGGGTQGAFKLISGRLVGQNMRAGAPGAKDEAGELISVDKWR